MQINLSISLVTGTGSASELPGAILTYNSEPITYQSEPLTYSP
jgi:hypothetical protein